MILFRISISQDKIIASIQSENMKLKEKNKKLKTTNNKIMVRLAEYQVKTWQYEKQLNLVRSKRFSTAADVEEIVSHEENMDEEISTKLTAEDIKELNAIEILKSGDRTFVRKMLEILCRGNLTAIHTRTLTKNFGENKSISPQKKAIITAMMTKRVGNLSDPAEKSERCDEDYINNCISKSLYYLKKTVPK